ncbi:MAG: leucyl-tRNA synthetase [Chlamydiota bacterium]|jgi:leucyl-tRNA synthetase
MDKQKYDHKRIEQKWQQIWEDREVFCAKIDPTRPKYYILDMFPYPSGSGLHVGHVTGYTATDILARYKRQKGFNVLHPMGWDSFGLPAEQYAIRTGTHPKITTEQNVNTYRRQLKSLGFSYDWSRELATSDPDYYKWTQWLFTKLYDRGLAYEAEMLVNFCPALGTVLSNEEVEDGRSKEGGFPIERRPLRQWILKITAYADRLLEDLDLLDWPDYLKKLQTNWIGRSEGAHITFSTKNSDKKITVFTTAAHTLFGVTYLVLSPEHPLVDEITEEAQKKEVEAYKKEGASKSDLERTDLAKEKTGVWTGAYVEHPVTGASIPLWIADYVLASYGTGAVMGVPAHDERDLLFAEKYSLPIKTVVTEKNTLVESQFLNGLTISDAKEKIIEWLEVHKKGERTVQYKLRDWLFSRQRYWGEPFPILHFSDGSKRVLSLDELPLMPPELSDYKPSSSGESPLAKVKEWVEIIDPKTGKPALRETNTMPQWAGSCWYYLRFCDPNNNNEAFSKESEKYWLPVDLYVGGVEHAVLHLLYARFWHKVFYDCGLVSTKEPFQTLRNQGLVVARSYQREGGGYVPPEEVKEEGGEYLHIGTGDPLISQIDKMSKSKLNGVTPDDMVEEFGADALRLYEMFMGPFDKEKVWNTDAVSGCKRFLNRFFDLVTSEKVTEEESQEGMKLIHRLTFAVEKEIELMQFNTAIAKMMEFMNAFSQLLSYPKTALKMLTQLLSPFAPHIAEEAWEILGGQGELTYAPFPNPNPAYLVDTQATYVVQINGKVRGKWTLETDLSEEELLAFVKMQPEVVKHLTGPIRKVIYVPNKLLSLVV